MNADILLQSMNGDVFIPDNLLYVIKKLMWPSISDIDQITENIINHALSDPRIRRNVDDDTEKKILKNFTHVTGKEILLQNKEDIEKILLGKKFYCDATNQLLKLLIGLVMMDVYVLGRVSKFQKSNNDTGSKKSTVSIIITGFAHTSNYLDFYKKIGYETLVEDDLETFCTRNPFIFRKNIHNK